jgi:hypothetical protein
MRFCENNNLSAGFVPVDMQTAANDGDWVSLKNYHHVSVVLFKAAGTAGDDPTLTMEQATTNTGTGAKALTFRNIYVKQGTLTAVGTFTRVDQTAAATYTDLVSAEIQAIWVVEFDSDELDVDGGFDHIRGRVADIGGNAQLGCMLYILGEPRYAQAVLPSAL